MTARNAVAVTLCHSEASAEEGHRWIPLRFDRELRRGRWWRIAYRASLFDPVVRPALRFETDQGLVDMLMPAPILGRAGWYGFAPRGGSLVWVSPGHTLPQHGFEIEEAAETSLLTVMAKAVSNEPLRTMLAAGLYLGGRCGSARSVLRYALDGTPVTHYHSWRTRHERPMDAKDAEGLEPQNWPSMHVVMSLVGRPSPERLAKTLSSLVAQTYAEWFVTFLVDAGSWIPRQVSDLVACKRAAFAPLSTPSRALADPQRREWFIALAPGDMLVPYAFAAVAHQTVQHPDVHVIYADEDAIDAAGRYWAPKLKPNWSPIYQRTSNYLGRAVWYHASIVAEAAAPPACDLISWPGSDAGARKLSQTSVRHLARLLVTTNELPPGGHIGTPKQGNSFATKPIRERSGDHPAVSIIIPSKDKARLLSACLDSLNTTTGPAFEIIVVDNGSAEPDTEALYKCWSNKEHFKIIRAPGPFNFARLCNRGVEAAKTSMLVFLNNDTVVLYPACPSSDKLRQIGSM